MKSDTKRILSALVGVALYISLCFWGRLPWAIGATVFAVLCAREWSDAYRKVEHSKIQPFLPYLGAIFPLALFFRLRVSPHNILLPAIPAAVLVLLFTLLTARAARTGTALGSLRKWYGIVGAVYIGMPWGSLVLLRALQPAFYPAPFGPMDRGAWLALITAFSVWAADTNAYFIGKRFGRHKLSARLSPGKTMEGAFGGLIGALVTAALLGYFTHLPMGYALLIGGIAGVFSPIGDLWESALKRELEIKDFGVAMPGHGGALDRFDGFFFVVSLVCFLFALLVPR